MGSRIVKYGLAIRIALIKRLCGRRIKVRRLGCLRGVGHELTGVDGAAGIRNVLQLESIGHDRSSEHMGFDPSLAIGQIASEVDQLTVDTFLDFDLLSVEVELDSD